jgi:hypothetical protein
MTLLFIVVAAPAPLHISILQPVPAAKQHWNMAQQRRTLLLLFFSLPP